MPTSLFHPIEPSLCMPDKRHPAPGHCLWWHGTAGKVAACPTEAKTGAQTCRQCVPCCGDSMWSVRTACCSTGDCGTSSPRGDGPISLKAVHPNVILACCLTGAASAGAAAWLCRVAQAPGGTSSGTSSSPGSPPPVFSIPGRLRRTKRPWPAVSPLNNGHARCGDGKEWG